MEKKKEYYAHTEPARPGKVCNRGIARISTDFLPPSTPRAQRSIFYHEALEEKEGDFGRHPMADYGKILRGRTRNRFLCSSPKNISAAYQPPKTAKELLLHYLKKERTKMEAAAKTAARII